ncbi:pyruvate carboxyltransferase [Brachyspira aalborgi]|jgi:4-hydroxy 2-oxovalerate aldolase|uniref:Pyruvate carboxyltransferase n=1 Tax=Brachyspira aalborgi TaxID=29522 RepID=A0AB38Q1Y6_9SPIR|nr:pyruvate carboxyltransferase [Brachyspira aalborgi]TXJ16639.1 pyruvate carboxyltransferase [Brachyspira aalborgi]TXJ22743.1 pyruvate carboxyltransferase [Brachyspira aalborgi]TXJ28458.1 pyruvate carboxyltransferase [Brachyspira aalborgi]TXJ50446.1 pyruvate carboxyltransferase [Brachyspira aalborgi]
MIGNITIFDCTFREAGYQTGWFFDKDFCIDYYKFAQAAGIDYLELGFFHNKEADPNRGYFRYCSLCNDEIKDIFLYTKNTVKLSAMRDIQRPLSDLLPKKETVIDAVRILTRSSETDFKILEKHINEIKKLGYEVFVNFTSSGHNTMERNKEFAKFAVAHEIPVIYFADTESVFTPEYVRHTIELCREEGVEAGIHLHDKNGTAEMLLDVALHYGCKYTDIAMMGLGGKWHDGNLAVEYFLRKYNYNPGYEQTRLKTMLIQNLIKYNKSTAAVL